MNASWAKSSLSRFHCSVAAFLLSLASAGAAPGGVEFWLTTGDRSHLLERESDLAFSSAAARDHAIAIDPARRYQSVEGFGAALTDASAFLIARALTAEQRASLLAELFGPQGLSLGLVRLTVGASDFSSNHYSFDDLPKGARDPQMEQFSIAPNREAVLPVLRQIRDLNPNVKVFAAPWSAPGWMKTSDRLIGGQLKPSDYSAYTRYLRNYVRAYEAEGIALYALTIQNEPGFTPADYPGMRVSAKARADFLGGHLGPLMAKEFPQLRLLDWDHNWDKPWEPEAVLRNKTASRYVAGVAWHCYAGDVAAQSRVHKRHPNKETWLTECSGGEWGPEFSGTLVWMARHLIIGGTRNWAKGVMLWNLALDQNHGPHLGGCNDCRGVVTIDTQSGVVTRNVEYYVLGHVSRFIHPGAVRINSTASIPGLDHVAFRNKDDGAYVLIVSNGRSGEASFSVTAAKRSFKANLPPKSLATFVWY